VSPSSPAPAGPRGAALTFGLILLAAGCGGGASSSGADEGGADDVLADTTDVGGGEGFPDPPDFGLGEEVTEDVGDDSGNDGGADAADLDGEDAEEIDAGPKVGEFGYPCDENAQCLSGYCVESELGKVCTDICIESCPPGWICALNAATGGDPIYICVSRFARICRPCDESSECNQNEGTSNACIDFGGDGSFCGVSCEDSGDCPTDYACEESTLASGAVVKQCVPESGECSCRADWIAQELATECKRENEFGSCQGERLCGPSGLTECSAQTPTEEVCNGVDDNCDGVIDPIGAGGCTNYWDDNDGDGFGVGLPVCSCAPPSFKSVTVGGDCNDLNTDVKPGAVEYCNGIDDNCDGGLDEPGADGCVEYYVDSDSDSFGDANNIVCLCKPNLQVTTLAGDCDDTKSGVHPDATEACNGYDDDCDAAIDELNADGCAPYFFDQDQDTFGVDGNFQCLCAAAGLFTAQAVGDCDDTRADVAPFKLELCDGIDNNCNGATDEGDPVELCGTVSNGAPACVNGLCVVSTCAAGYYDIDFSIANGCECKANTVEVSGAQCGGAFALGTLSDNNATVTVQGNAVYADESDWYRFVGSDGPDGNWPGGYFCDSYHVRVRFLWNPGNAYRFDVQRGNCAAANQICVQSQDFSWRTDFYENFKGECPCHPQLALTAPGVQQCSDNSAEYFIRVYRDPAVPPSCEGYNLEITNGVY
jgi:hypothetical protein